MTDLSVDSTARAQAAAVRAGEISARELLELHLDRIGEASESADTALAEALQQAAEQ